MPEAKQKWDDVGDRFADLGRKMKQRYEANAAFGDEQEKVNDALRQLGDALESAFNAVGASFRDAEIRDDMKGAGVAIGDAVAATFNDVAAEIKKAVRR